MLIIIIIITIIIIIIIIMVIIVLSTINISQLKILQLVIHWCWATTSCQGKPNNILSFPHVSSTFVSIFAEYNSADS